MTTLLNQVKPRLGIFYTEPTKDAEISQMISGATAFLKNAGVPNAVVDGENVDPAALEAIVIYCKMAQNTDPVEMRMNPVLVSIIDQLRNVDIEAKP